MGTAFEAMSPLQDSDEHRGTGYNRGARGSIAIVAMAVAPAMPRRDGLFNWILHGIHGSTCTRNLSDCRRARRDACRSRFELQLWGCGREQLLRYLLRIA